ncbi:sorting and assembly machinery component 50 homolog B isoform X2 [Nematostella vectensis]|uniref:sorting and assembly machinery component 50 homolog B isoform X2 n=1 Tax=Nematostella vectensis TaxID=45351 RepID=UPI002077762C|nr:sorting and assembly machinery component 50 homolog B isoform X2 [Nematostella vectensis]XP_048585598.1 sorting and assembly machinery component 50 homolog B isoform X2 [Nematostella vectensis]
MGAVQARKMDSEDKKEFPEEESEASSLLYSPAVVQRVHIEGLKKTKADFVTKQVKKIFEATTFGEALAYTYEARENLQNLEIFKDIDIFIDTSSGPKAHPDGLDITFTIEEKKLLTSNIGTQVGNNEGTMVFGLKMNNLMGRGENVNADVGFGTRTKTNYQLGFTKPFHGKSVKSFRVVAHKTATEFPMSSFKEASQGVDCQYNFSSLIGKHSIGWEGTWREITGLSKKTSFTVREQAGHSLKSSLLHTLVSDSRDSIAFPTEGSLLRISQEVAGLGGDVRFIKHNVELQESLEVAQDVVMSWSLQAGILNTLPNEQSKINDRFFLGGPLSVRGFQMKGLGPRSEGDSLGGDAYWAAGLHLYTPLPFRPGEGSFGDHIKTHGFINAGNLTQLNCTLPWRERLDPLRSGVRWSYGFGLVFILGVARVEVNYCLPKGVHSDDGVNHGLQVGIGMNFL